MTTLKDDSIETGLSDKGEKEPLIFPKSDMVECRKSLDAYLTSHHNKIEVILNDIEKQSKLIDESQG